MTEFRPGGFKMIPPVIKNLIIANVLVFIAQQVFANNPYFDFDNTFALHDIHSVYFKPYQLITHLFMHGGFDHIFFNMFALWMFGRILENVWGAKRFLFFYLACGIGAAALHLTMQYFRCEQLWQDIVAGDIPSQQRIFGAISPALGASGAIMGLFAAFAYLFPNTELIFLFIPFPIKAKWMVLIMVGLDLFGGFSNTSGDNVAHFAHLGGAITGFIIVFIWNKTNRRTLY